MTTDVRIVDEPPAPAVGDQSAWDAIVDEYGSRVWAVARAHRLNPAGAEGVIQLTFLRLVTHIEASGRPVVDA